MLFTSYAFIAFICILFIAYYCFPKRWQWVLLLAASYVFYIFAGWECLIFILVTTLSAYVVARLMERESKKEEKYLASFRDKMDKDERKKYKAKAKKMLVNYGIGLIVIFAILVAVPYLVQGIALLVT